MTSNFEGFLFLLKKGRVRAAFRVLFPPDVQTNSTIDWLASRYPRGGAGSPGLAEILRGLRNTSRRK